MKEGIWVGTLQLISKSTLLWLLISLTAGNTVWASEELDEDEFEEERLSAPAEYQPPATSATPAIPPKQKTQDGTDANPVSANATPKAATGGADSAESSGDSSSESPIESPANNSAENVTEAAEQPASGTSATVQPEAMMNPGAIDSASDAATVEPTAQPTLEILGAEVLPGSARIINWELESSFQDVSAPVPVLVVNGETPGPTLCLTAAVHGDELNGIEIVRRVIYEVDPQKISGAVIGVPIVNLEGFKRATRYLPDRRDLNRYFPGRIKGSYASRIANSFFTKVIRHCHYLADLHTGSLSRTNLPQIRANLSDPAVAAMAEKMGSIVVLQSRGGLGTLRRAATDAGIPAVTLEAGAPNNLQKDAVEEGVKTILSALSSLGITAKPFWKRSQEPVFYRSKWIRARQGGILFSKVELGDNVKEGSVLGLLSNPITNKTTEILSPLEGRVIGMALNQVMYPGFAAYHIGLKSSVVEAAQPDDFMPEEPSDSDMEMPDTDTSQTDAPITDQAELSSGESAASSAVPEISPEESPTSVEEQSNTGEIEDMELPTATDE